MLSIEQNLRLTQVGSGTPAGELFRRYWLPVKPAQALVENPVLKISILGETLVLFRDRSGSLGLVDERCPHRQTSLALGIPEKNGLRCCYHGWLFGKDGSCLEMPLEPKEFASKVRIRSYPVEEMGGLIWAYLGPQPAPVLPRWDLYVSDEAFRQIIGHTIPTNWLQVAENQADPGHIPYGHGRFFQYALERQGMLSEDPRTFYNASYASAAALAARGVHPQFRPIFNDHGYAVARKNSDEGDDVQSWNVGTGATFFPAMLSSGPGDMGRRIRRWYQVVVPLDDTTTWQFQYFAYFFPEGVDVPRQNEIPYSEIPLRNSRDEHILDFALGQDIAIFQEQGVLTDRSKERLGANDTIVVAMRKMLAEQIDVVASNRDPINVFRDEAAAERPDRRIPGAQTGLPSRGHGPMVAEPFHKAPPGGRLMIDDVVDRYNRDRDTIIELYARSEEVLAERSKD